MSIDVRVDWQGATLTVQKTQGANPVEPRVCNALKNPVAVAFGLLAEGLDLGGPLRGDRWCPQSGRNRVCG